MSLERYRRARMVVLSPNSSVHAAARAMADNHIGSVLVAERRQLLGIVADRDLALDVAFYFTNQPPAVREFMENAPPARSGYRAILLAPSAHELTVPIAP